MHLPSIQSISKRYRHLLTVQNAGLVIASVIALAWMWGAVVTLQRNYAYQRQVDMNTQQIELKKLQNKTYEYQQAYYRSSEYLELSARAKLGLALPGEHSVVLPSSVAIQDTVQPVKTTAVTENESNFSRWMHFFFDAR